jgi:CheY-like chemotaxis protein
MTGAEAGLAGKRVLVVEDEALVSMLLEDMLADLGCAVVGPAGCVAEALAVVARTEAIDVALLDLELGGERSHPVAEALAARRVPFAFVSGHGRDAAEGSAHAGAPVLDKPFGRAALAAMLARLAKGG